MDLTTRATPDYERPTADLLDLFEGKFPLTRDQMEQRLKDARQVKVEKATIVIASWESRFVAAGGVRAVTQAYARHLAENNRTVLVVTPLHTGLRTPPGAAQLVKSVFWVNFEEKNHRVELFKSKWATVEWVFLHCDGFFTAEGGRDRSNPYLYQEDAEKERQGLGSPRLVRDSLFYAAALPTALCALGLSDNVILHLQDWVTVAAALTVKTAILRNQINRAICVLALHNPYDKHLGSDGWAKLTDLDEPTETPATFLGRMWPLVDAPVATVSREFAKDLTTDPLQTTHFADQLQGHLKKYRIIGVDNGAFEAVDPPFGADAIRNARAGHPEAILEKKKGLRDTMKTTMAAYRPNERWGDIDFAGLADEVPVFMCNGRFEPGQKGFDVTARAIEQVLDGGLDARFVLTPIVGDAPDLFVDDLKALAKKYVGYVVVYPFRMQEGYQEIQAGCTFSLWPSMYEPFGGVSEFLLRGTPVIARATGGLRQQIKGFDRSTGEGNGILYPDYLRTPGRDEWRNIQQSAHPRHRMNYPIYQDQVEELARAIEEAVDIFHDPVAYGKLLSNVHDSVSGYYWGRAAKEYEAIYIEATE